jgi:hypothetical protein
MIIGLDFDNTIVNYDEIFHRVANEMGIIPSSMVINKFAIREHLSNSNQEHLWT